MDISARWRPPAECSKVHFMMGIHEQKIPLDWNRSGGRPAPVAEACKGEGLFAAGIPIGHESPA